MAGTGVQVGGARHSSGDQSPPSSSSLSSGHNVTMQTLAEWREDTWDPEHSKTDWHFQSYKATSVFNASSRTLLNDFKKIGCLMLMLILLTFYHRWR